MKKFNDVIFNEKHIVFVNTTKILNYVFECFFIDLILGGIQQFKDYLMFEDENKLRQNFLIVDIGFENIINGFADNFIHFFCVELLIKIKKKVKYSFALELIV